MKQKFKVGDIVKGNEKSDVHYSITNSKMTRARVISVEDFQNKEIISIEILEHDWYSGHTTFDVHAEYFDLVERKNNAIVIYCKGNEVIALDKANNKKAVARCNPEDTFDFETGARLAFERLFEKPKYNARVVCICAKTDCFTDGKIYEVKDGFIYGNNNRPDNIYPLENFEELSRALRSSFIEIKED